MRTDLTIMAVAILFGQLALKSAEKPVETITVTNTEFGFEIKFPKDWVESEDEDEKRPVSYVSPDGNIRAYIEVFTAQEGIDDKKLIRMLNMSPARCMVIHEYSDRYKTNIRRMLFSNQL